MAGNLVVCDPRVQDMANFVVSTYISSNSVHLFTNNITPTPANVVTDFVEASYPGYSSQFFGSWSSPVGVLPGQYAITSPSVTFPAPASGGTVTIYGVWVLTGSGSLWFSWLLATPLNINPGDPDVVVQVVYDVWAAELI